MAALWEKDEFSVVTSSDPTQEKVKTTPNPSGDLKNVESAASKNPVPRLFRICLPV